MAPGRANGLYVVVVGEGECAPILVVIDVDSRLWRRKIFSRSFQRTRTSFVAMKARLLNQKLQPHHEPHIHTTNFQILSTVYAQPGALPQSAVLRLRACSG